MELGKQRSALRSTLFSGGSEDRWYLVSRSEDDDWQKRERLNAVVELLQDRIGAVFRDLEGQLQRGHDCFGSLWNVDMLLCCRQQLYDAEFGV
jgi:hypothetical protein